MWPDRVLVTSAIVAAMKMAGMAAAQDAPVHWTAAEKGAIPAEAIPLGREGDGRDQFVCRGAVRGTIQVGNIANGYPGCNVSYRGRAISLSAYEVMTRVPASVSERMARVSRERRELGGARVGAGAAPLGGPVAEGGPARVAGDVKRGFDEHGQPYVEERRSDGTVVRYRRDGIATTRPDGTSDFKPYQVMREDVLPATPPQLPDDPRRGRVWIDRHNAALLDVIRDQVQNDEDEMNRFFAGEKAAGNEDPFQQIVYRTTIADFLAKSR
jgi:DM9 repeat